MRHTTISTRRLPALLVACALLLGWTAWTLAEPSGHELKGWKKGRGWGWVWGKDDEVGSLNAMTPQSVLEAIGLVKQGKIYDLGIDYDRTSYKWPGHSPGEIISFRTPEGVKRQQDLDFTAPSVNPALLAWHSCALFINDNVATQIDSLGHITTGEDNHWYNGFTEAEWGGNFGIRKADASTIPPIVVRGVLIDVADHQGVEALSGGTAIGPKDLEAALEKQGTTLKPGDAVFVRTGTLRYWGDAGGDHQKIGAHTTRPGSTWKLPSGWWKRRAPSWWGPTPPGWRWPRPRPEAPASFRSTNTCWWSRGSMWPSFTTWRIWPPTGSTSSATSPPPTRSRAAPPASPCGR